MGRVLRTEDEIRAAGAAAAAAWPAPDPATVDAVAVILGPAADVAYGPLDAASVTEADTSKAA
jgi:hypothetical protein